MILIQSQLCSIDQSDLFIQASRKKGKTINPAPPSLAFHSYFLLSKVSLSVGAASAYA